METKIKEHSEMWHEPIAEVFKYLHSSINGLSGEQAEGRLKSGGRNELPETKPTSWLAVFYRQLSSVLIKILLGATVISFVIGERVDSAVILAAVVLNVLVGGIQEKKAEQALFELRKVVSNMARVLRNKKEILIKAAQVVPGDILIITEGDKVSADARLIEVNNFEVSEATLTGESSSVLKLVKAIPAGTALADRVNMIYMGTSVVRGVARAVVVATGLKTEIGQIAKLLQQTKNKPTPLQIKLAVLAKKISIIVLSLSFLIFIFGIIMGFPIREMFVTAVAISVAAVPEGLAVVITVILTIGMRRILKQNGLVRELLAAETLGSTTVICTDKTGTLTTGEMRVALLYHPGQIENGETPTQHALADQGMLKIFAISSDAYIENPQAPMNDWKVRGTSTEKALIIAAMEAGINIDEARGGEPRLDEDPFDSEKKYMMTLNQVKDSSILYLKGAPEIVLAKCESMLVKGKGKKLTAATRAKIALKIDELSSQGLRLLAVAKLEVGQPVKKIKDLKGKTPFVLVGVVGVKDPLRENVKQTIATANRAGIKVVMITGDHKLTAMAIAKEAGLMVDEGSVIDGSELKQLSDEALRNRIRSINVFARTTPHDKPRIVSAWIDSGEVVAMTGDGVNDAPALKNANIGIALGTGSDVSKEVADIVLLNNDFSTIIAAIEQGRVIFHNIKKTITYIMSDSFSGIILLFSAFIIQAIFIPDLPLPILATQILWINLVTDTFPALAFTVDKTSPEIMTEKPIKVSEPILDWRRKFIIVFMSTVRGLAALGLFIYLWQLSDDMVYARTAAFCLLVISSLTFALSSKQMLFHIWHKRTWNNNYLLMAIAGALLLQLLVVYAPGLQRVFQTMPLAANDWLLITALAGLIIIMVESVKHFFIKYYR